MKPQRTLALMLASASFAIQAQPNQPIRQVDSVKLLMVEALQSPSGKATAYLTGQMFDMMTKYFDAQDRPAAVVRRLKAYRQPGCGRLKVVIAQNGVLNPLTNRRENRASVYELDYCVDGRAPIDKTEVQS